LTQDLDEIWRKLDKKSSRYSIRRAQQDGINLRINRDYDEFYQMNKNLLKNKGFSTIYVVGVPKADVMEKYGTLFTAEHKGETLGGHLYLEDGANIKLWYSASKRLGVDRDKATLIGNANRLLHWEAIKYAKDKGIKEFDWGGLCSQEEADKDERLKAINSFKLSFGGEIVTYYSYQKVYSKAYELAQFLYGLASGGIRPVK